MALSLDNSGQSCVSGTPIHEYIWNEKVDLLFCQKLRS